MSNEPTQRITLSDDDQVDPYPVLLDVLDEAFTLGRTLDAMGGSEPQIIDAMRQACIDVLKDRDPASVNAIDWK